MGCGRFETEALLRLEIGLPLESHFDSCPECIAAREQYEHLREHLSTLTFEPSSDWEDRVRERVRAVRKESTASDDLGATLFRGFTESESAFDLLEFYRPSLRRWVSSRLPILDHNDVDDLIQDTLLATWKDLSRSDRHVGSLLTFVRRVLHDRMMKRARGSEEPTDAAMELSWRYENAFQRLEPADRNAILARLEFDTPWQELVDAGHAPTIAAARMAVTRALTRLAGEMSVGGIHARLSRESGPAFDLLELFRPRLRSRVGSSFPDLDHREVDDAIREAFLSVVWGRRAPTGRSAVYQIESVLAFMRQAVLNRMRDRVRARPLPKAHAARIEEPIDTSVSSGELLERYEAALNRLGTADRDAIVARLELATPWRELVDAGYAPSVAAAQLAVARALTRLEAEMKVLARIYRENPVLESTNSEIDKNALASKIADGQPVDWRIFETSKATADKAIVALRDIARIDLKWNSGIRAFNRNAGIRIARDFAPNRNAGVRIARGFAPNEPRGDQLIRNPREHPKRR